MVEPCTDEALYQAWAAGDRRAGGSLVDRHVPPISRFFANKVWHGDDVEDLVGKTFEACARDLGKFRAEGSFRAYLFGIAHNILRRYLRDKRHREDAPVGEHDDARSDDSPSPSAVLGRCREERVLLRALRALPIDLQLVLELSFFEELSRTEIACVLEIPGGTVASRFRRAQAELAEQVARLSETRAIAESTVHGLADWAKSLRDQLSNGGQRRLARMQR
ncbi:MAG: sigma-70 family RNA polymerase sigma factor [Deltaproteobacteria bacterium]|nr:sigma-70 family RNA polymerase sigma factor [Nannocystaceae bacterium]